MHLRLSFISGNSNPSCKLVLSRFAVSSNDLDEAVSEFKNNQKESQNLFLFLFFFKEYKVSFHLHQFFPLPPLPSCNFYPYSRPDVRLIF
ncbi:hypothetical protein BpHYR1_001199 [Brachionus plicatilis]|uniref:Uncharacterized protein n=1 Tax=Brachionus plicatilis TaxID=10195 RepID=A0A3M7PAE9_BRAPC|nr:hypothetical protein BpHYR1_001199 [Brachionus plicatilis]